MTSRLRFVINDICSAHRLSVSARASKPGSQLKQAFESVRLLDNQNQMHSSRVSRGMRMRGQPLTGVHCTLHEPSKRSIIRSVHCTALRLQHAMLRSDRQGRSRSYLHLWRWFSCACPARAHGTLDVGYFRISLFLHLRIMIYGPWNGVV